MSESPFADTDLTILRFEGEGVVDYGPTGTTKLLLTGIDPSGARHAMVFTGDAMRQLAELLKDVNLELPGAMRGH